MRLGFHQDASLEANRVCTGPGVGCVFAGQGVSASEKKHPRPPKNRPREIAPVPEKSPSSQTSLGNLKISFRNLKISVRNLNISIESLHKSLRNRRFPWEILGFLEEISRFPSDISRFLQEILGFPSEILRFLEEILRFPEEI